MKGNFFLLVLLYHELFFLNAWHCKSHFLISIMFQNNEHNEVIGQKYKHVS